MELIYREKLLEEYDKTHVGEPGQARRLIVEAPEVDAEPVRHAKWIPYKAYLGKNKDSWVDEVRCSVCWYAFGEPEWKYCPECGSRMDVEMETDQSCRPIKCDYCKHWHGLKRDGRYWCSKHSMYMETGCEEGEREEE